jgi:CSLREA domain-containing protein
MEDRSRRRSGEGPQRSRVRRALLGACAVSVAAGGFLLSALVVAAPAASAATTYTVTTTADESGACLPASCSLREAVEAANGAGEASRIVLPAGEYVLTKEAEGSDLTIKAEVAIEGAGAGVTTIKQGAECNCRVLYLDGSGAVTISGVTVAAGNVVENPHGEDGGDILFEHGSLLRLQRDVITEGVAGNGRGGGIAVHEGKLQLLDSTVSGNRALSGGGLFVEYDSREPVTVERDTFVGNEAYEKGGALLIELGSVFVTNSTFTQNQAGDGGAIATESDGELILLNDTLAGDSTVAHELPSARALGRASAPPALAAPGFGAELYDVAGAPLSVLNTIVGPAGEGQAGSECDLDTTMTSESNIDAGESCAFEGGSHSNTNPLLEPLADNGGPTKTMALSVSSPAINTADAKAAVCPSTDQRGVSRPQGAGCDIGAYEYVFPETPSATTTTTTTTATTALAPAPRLEVKSSRASLSIVRARIAAAGLPATCTRAGLHLHLSVALSPHALALRSTHGHPLVKVHVVVRLDGRRIAVRNSRRFRLDVALGQFGVGRNTLTVTVTSSGRGVRTARRTRTFHFSRCLPAPVFTG